MERLEEYKADRNSRSLEETKGEKLLPRINRITMSDTCSIGGGKSTHGKWAAQFKNLTEYDKSRHDEVKAFVDALRRLEDRGILKHCGTCKTH